MKTTFKSVVTALFCSLALMATSCESNDPNPGIPFKDLNASSFSGWTYFSFSKGDTVKVTNPTTDMGWDIAFHRQDIRVNASEHFSGMGGIYKTDKTDFNAVVLGDVKGNYMRNVMARRTNAMDYKKMLSGASLEELYEYVDDYYVTNASTDKKNDYTTYNFDMKAHGSSAGTQGETAAARMYPIVPNVYIVKAADGKSIYKFQVNSSTGSNGKRGGFLNFKYDKIQ